MIGVSTALAGVPPTGLGVFAWLGSIPAGPWAWYAVDARHQSVIAEAKRRGPTWLFRGPSAWTRDTWRETLAAQVAVASRPFSGIEGIVANPEAGWETASEQDFLDFGAALAAAALVTRVGVVTIPSWRGFARTARAAGRGVWWSIELYARTIAPAQFAGHVARWRAVVGHRVIPTVAAFVPETSLGRQWISRERYAAYLDAVPQAGGAIVWPGVTTEWMREGLAARYGSGLGSRVLALPWAALSLSDTWAGLGLALLLAAALVAVALSPRWRSRLGV